MDLSRAYQCPVTGRYFDPLRVRRHLLSEELVNKWITEEPRSPESEERLVAVARQAFGLPEINAETGQGWTDGQTLAALDAFTEYLAGKPETGQTSPTSAPCTGC